MVWKKVKMWSVEGSADQSGSVANVGEVREGLSFLNF